MTHDSTHQMACCSLERLIRSFGQQYRLTERETEIVGLMADGCTNTESMAVRMGISPNTVNNQLKSIFDKVGASSKSDVLAMMVAHVCRQVGLPRLVGKVPRVLVVDDQVDVRETVSGVLASAGCRVRTASSVDEAVPMVPVFAPDLVVTDMRMPGRDGRALIEEVRRASPYSPQYLVMTGYSDYRLDEMYAIGAAGCLSKPFKPAECLAAVNKILMNDAFANGLFFGSSDDAVGLPKLQTSDKHIGFGGAFVPMDPDRLVSPTIGQGSMVRLVVQFDNAPALNTSGEVVWVRRSASDGAPSGVGVRFAAMRDDDRMRLEDLIKLRRIMDFIPLGTNE